MRLIKPDIKTNCLEDFRDRIVSIGNLMIKKFSKNKLKMKLTLKKLRKSSKKIAKELTNIQQMSIKNMLRKKKVRKWIKINKLSN